MKVAAVDLPPPTVDPERVRRAVEEVLARREYQPLRPSPLQRVVRWMFEQMGRLIDSLGGTGGTLLAWAVILIVGAVFVAIAVWFLRGVRSDRGVVDTVAGTTGRTAAEWAADATRHEEASRWREALRCRYHELVAEFAAAGLVEEASGRTTGEYLEQICASLPDATTSATALTSMFEGAWYGNAPVGSGEVAALRSRADEARRLAGLRAGVSA